MIHFVVALPCEARPLIDEYRMKALRTAPLPIYEFDGGTLVVTGVGKLNAVLAVGLLQGLYADRNSVWINVGVAGHPCRQVGESILANRITDQASGSNYYPSIVFEPRCDMARVITVDKEERELPEDAAYEMEAAGFFPAANRFSPVELIQSFKVISDTRDSDFSNVTEALVSEWVGRHVGVVDSLARQLVDLRDETVPPRRSEAVDEICKRWRFSTYQQHQLNRLVDRINLLSETSLTVESLNHMKNAKEVIAYLSEHVDSLSIEIRGTKS